MAKKYKERSRFHQMLINIWRMRGTYSERPPPIEEVYERNREKIEAVQKHLGVSEPRKKY